MSISTRLLVLDYANLDVHCFDRGPISVVQREDIPAEGLIKLNHFDLLQFMETVGHSHGYLLRGVALISTKV